MLAQSFDAVRPAALQHDQDMQRRRAQSMRHYQELARQLDKETDPRKAERILSAMERTFSELRKMGG